MSLHIQATDVGAQTAGAGAYVAGLCSCSWRKGVLEPASADANAVMLVLPMGSVEITRQASKLSAASAGEHGEMAHLRRMRGGPGSDSITVAPTLGQGRACRVLPAGDPVQCCQVPVDAAAFQHQECRGFQVGLGFKVSRWARVPLPPVVASPCTCCNN